MERADSSRPSSRIILPAEPLKALPATMGLTAMIGARRRRSSSFMPSISSIGRIT